MIGTILGGLIIVVALIITVPICIIVARFEPKRYTRLVSLENQRRQIAQQIVTEASEADWLTNFLFKRYLRKGGNHL